MSEWKQFGCNLAYWRTRAHTEWAMLASPSVTPPPASSAGIARSGGELTTIPPALPGYLLDRYAYRCFKREVLEEPSKNDLSRYLPVPDETWASLLSDVLVGISSVDLAPPTVTAFIGSSRVLSDLLCRWRAFLSSLHIDYPPSYFSDPAGKTWAEFFRKSALFPNRPAILGPTFVDRLSQPERDELIGRVGIGGIRALYIFLVQIHEECHLLQTGDPMLNEVHFAWLWCNFLTTENQWWWQRSVDHGATFNLEYPWVSQLAFGESTIPHLLGDSFLVVSATEGSNPGMTYDLLCEWAWKFDHARIKYADYLQAVTDIYSARGLRRKRD